MFPPFPEEPASAYCRELIADLASGAVQMEQLTPVSAQRAEQGIMLGVLVCTAADGSLVVLRTVSGIRCRLDCDNFVEPIVSAAEVSRALQKNDGEIHSLTEKINTLKNSRRLPDGAYAEQTDEERSLCRTRLDLCGESLQSVLSLYSFCCADGLVRDLLSMVKKRLPPTGTGDCCAPKLLSYAFAHALTPVSMAEVFYERNASSLPIAHGVALKTVPPCDIRCALILPAILGLHILYRDDDIIVVNKQSGVLSVPGRGPEKQDCIVSRVLRLFPSCIAQPAVHRLDMETSGLMVLAFTQDAHRALNRQFENREVQKEYIAVIDGILPARFEPEGQMELFFSLDVEHRPHQIWDAEHGKSAVTEWHSLGTERYTAPDGSARTVTRIRFVPHTGRTHQLRLAAADSHGFGVPIVGDTLYGFCAPGERLLLHAETLCFAHPITGHAMEFHCAPDF